MHPLHGSAAASSSAASSTEEFYRLQAESMARDNKALRQRLEQCEQENRELKRSLYELSVRYNRGLHVLAAKGVLGGDPFLEDDARAKIQHTWHGNPSQHTPAAQQIHHPHHPRPQPQPMATQGPSSTVTGPHSTHAVDASKETSAYSSASASKGKKDAPFPGGDTSAGESASDYASDSATEPLSRSRKDSSRQESSSNSTPLVQESRIAQESSMQKQSSAGSSASEGNAIVEVLSATDPSSAHLLQESTLNESNPHTTAVPPSASHTRSPSPSIKGTAGQPLFSSGASTPNCMSPSPSNGNLPQLSSGAIPHGTSTTAPFSSTNSASSSGNVTPSITAYSSSNSLSNSAQGSSAPPSTSGPSSSISPSISSGVIPVSQSNMQSTAGSSSQLSNAQTNLSSRTVNLESMRQELATEKTSELASFTSKVFYMKSEIKAGSSALYSVKFSPCGRFVACGSFDKRVRIYDVSQQKELFSHAHHTFSVMDVSWSADSSEVFSGGFDKALCLFDVQTGKLKQTMDVQGLIQSVIITPNLDDRVYLATTSAKTICLIDPRQSISKPTIIECDAIANTLAANPGDSYFLSGDSKGRIKFWDIRQRACFQTITNEESGRPISHLAFSHSGDQEDGYLAVNSYDNVLRVYEREESMLSEQDIIEQKPATASLLLRHSLRGIKNKNLPIRSSFFTGKNYHNRNVRQYSFESQHRASVVEDLEGQPQKYVNIHDSLLLASGSADNNIYLYDVSGPQGSAGLIQQLEGHTDRVYCVDFHPTDPVLVSCGADARIKFWTIRSKGRGMA